MNTSAKQAIGRSHGFTLVEIMVALAIGTVIMLGATTVFMSTLRSYTVQNGVSETSDTGRYALQYLSRHLRMAGYRDSDWARGPLEDALDFANGTSDSFTVTYESEFGCNLVSAGAVTQISNEFDVVDGDLRCNGRKIIDGIDEMQIFLGEDTDGDSIVDRYVDPGTAGLDLNNVVTVSLNLLVRSESDRVSGGAAALAFDFWNTGDADDGRLRREYSSIVEIRNIR
jgi:type IV pilus assembly protein PilW